MAHRIMTKTCEYCNKSFTGTTLHTIKYCSMACRFWSKVNITDPIKCWEWNRPLHHSGYAHFHINHVKHMAHRIAWFLTHGYVPEELDVLHKCDNCSCVNPNHLFLGNALINRLDMVEKGRAMYAKGESNGMAKLSTDDIFKIKQLLKMKYHHRDIAKLFNVTKSTITCINIEKTWRHIQA